MLLMILVRFILDGVDSTSWLGANNTTSIAVEPTSRISTRSLSVLLPGFIVSPVVNPIVALESYVVLIR